MEKLNKYYKRMAESDMHIIAMGSHFQMHIYIILTWLYLALDPWKKFVHFKKNWDPMFQEVKELIKSNVHTGSQIN